MVKKLVAIGGGENGRLRENNEEKYREEEVTNTEEYRSLEKLFSK